MQVGDVPGRLEPGTGETNYHNIYKVLRGDTQVRLGLTSTRSTRLTCEEVARGAVTLGRGQRGRGATHDNQIPFAEAS